MKERTTIRNTGHANGGANGGVKLKKCTACHLVRYCSDACQQDHRPKHKRECKKRAAELRYMMKFYSSKRTLISVTVRFAVCCCLLMSKKTNLNSCCSKRTCKGVFLPIRSERPREDFSANVHSVEQFRPNKWKNN